MFERIGTVGLRFSLGAGLTLLLVGFASPALGSRSITFDQRVAAQEAIERVHHSHTIGTEAPFESVMTREMLESKVRAYLRQSAALESFWNTPVTAEMLSRELERIARDSRLPGRLDEIYRSLGNDPFLIEECFARASLVDRMSRSFFASDRRIHAPMLQRAQDSRRRLLAHRTVPGQPVPRVLDVRLSATGGALPERAAGGFELGPAEFRRMRERFPARAEQPTPLMERSDAFVVSVIVDEQPASFRVASYVFPKRTWSSWWQESGKHFDAARVEAVALPGRVSRDAVAAAQSVCFPDNSWRGGTFDDFEERDGHTAVWTGSLMLVWGGQSGPTLLDTGHRYDPLTDSWTPMTTTGAPTPRLRHTAVWTGTEMAVWGGWTGAVSNHGGRYDPATDSWTPMTTTNAPAARENHTAVWTGSEVLVWGGRAGPVLNSGGRYDPTGDSWTAMTTTNSPLARQWHAAVWAGSRMVVWGGWNGTPLDSGGRYDPVTDTWTSTETTGAPVSRNAHTAVWTGERVVVWGGYDASSTALDSGGRYDPDGDGWTSTSTVDAPEGRTAHGAVWTGGEMLIWGGTGAPGILDSGGRYDPDGDSWTSMSTVNAPAARTDHTTVWTGSRMIVWGGRINTRLRSGGRYDPATDSWTPTGPAVPTGRAGHTAVWTGNLMLVWGGSNSNVGFEQTGGRYDPLLDSWTATATEDAPQPRAGHTAVWTGGHMIVWGGNTGEPTRPNTGGRYNPLADRWSETSTNDAPDGRVFHTAVWAGDSMIVWGGFPDLQTGGRYDPIGNNWVPTATNGAPLGRYWHTAVWSGEEMIVWGGYNDPSFLGDGSRYDPSTDTWDSISITDPPAARALHTATWTGNRMFVWGGNDLTFAGTGTRFDTGALYNPTNNKWTTAETVGAPSGRDLHSAIWTGSEVVVWGGQSGPAFTPFDVETGGRFEPGANGWVATSTTGAPSARRGHAAIWTGSEMLVWGGDSGPPSGPVSYPRQWGKYALGHNSDDDGDGLSECAGDCDDANGTIYPGAPELCDSRDNDCDGTLSPAEHDGDADGSPFCADCDDADPSSYPDAPELCDNLDNDCDQVVDEMTTVCGLGECRSVGFCSGGVDSCQPGEPSGEICDGLDNDCDGVVPPDELDSDEDGLSTCDGDCDDGNQLTYPGAIEVNEGQDNQCPGDPGFGLIDEIEGWAGFDDPADSNAFCWTAQPLAREYEPSRSSSPDRPVDCARTITIGTCWSDPTSPPPGVVFHYLVRSLCPWTGSLGADSSGTERVGLCENPFPACIDDSSAR